eukprot:359527-Chlamydomonas_euryale.AAC.2
MARPSAQTRLRASLPPGPSQSSTQSRPSSRTRGRARLSRSATGCSQGAPAAAPATDQTGRCV